MASGAGRGRANLRLLEFSGTGPPAAGHKYARTVYQTLCRFFLYQ